MIAAERADKQRIDELRRQNFKAYESWRGYSEKQDAIIAQHAATIDKLEGTISFLEKECAAYHKEVVDLRRSLRESEAHVKIHLENEKTHEVTARAFKDAQQEILQLRATVEGLQRRLEPDDPKA